MKKSKYKKLAKKFVKRIEKDKDLGDYKPKYYGSGLVVAFDIDGLTNSHCQCAEWTNGEGYDFSFSTKYSG